MKELWILQAKVAQEAIDKYSNGIKPDVISRGSETEKLTDKAIRALKICEAHQESMNGITPLIFAREYFKIQAEQASKMALSAGRLLGKLRKRGLLDERNYLTDKGKRLCL